MKTKQKSLSIQMKLLSIVQTTLMKRVPYYHNLDLFLKLKNKEKKILQAHRQRNQFTLPRSKNQAFFFFVILYDIRKCYKIYKLCLEQFGRMYSRMVNIVVFHLWERDSQICKRKEKNTSLLRKWLEDVVSGLCYSKGKFRLQWHQYSLETS